MPAKKIDSATLSSVRSPTAELFGRPLKAEGSM
jgi:hypothetical protein